MNAEPKPCMHQDLKDISIIVRSMDIWILNANPSQHGHQTIKKRYGTMETLKIGIKIQDIAVIIVKNMDMSLRIVLEHTSVVTTKGG